MWTDTLIIGAGPTGLSAAYHYPGDSIIVEKESRVGGLCRSIYDRGFIFDHAGHIFFTSDPYVSDVLAPALLGENLHWQYREAWVYSKGTFTRYPFQAGTYGLPPEVIKECILGAVEAARRYDAARCPATFMEFIESTWGSGIARHFMVPYNRKLWTVPLEEMGWDWLNGRVPQPNLEEIIDGALRPQPKPMGPNARFGYPLHGGFEALMRGWLKHLDCGRIWLNTAVVAIDLARQEATMSDGRVVHFEHLINTAPLPEFLKLLSRVPAEVRAAAAKLRHVSIRCVNLGVARPDLTEKHWIYYPEESPLFHRLFIQSNTSPFVVPAGCSSLTAEISYSPTKPLPVDGEALIQRVIEDCQAVGMLRPTDRIVVANQVDAPYAYVIPDLNKVEAVRYIQEWLRPQGVISAGRFGEWEYLNTDQSFLAGRRAAEQIRPVASWRPAVVAKPVVRSVGREMGMLASPRERTKGKSKEAL
ncbi:MAG: FAD-dependent oxidoreductase [Firmicutes bacterium]|nr:FAD-dependent oxidoreductase [Bacillota bacterium]